MKTGPAIKSYLRFSKKERIAFIVLLVFICGFALFPFLPFFKTSKTTVVDGSWSDSLKPLQQRDVVKNNNEDNDADVSYYQSDKTEQVYQPERKGRLFEFDPNTLTEAGWKELGLRERTIRTLLNYRNKGGRFRKPDDLQKIYGLRPDEFQRLKPYIVIASSNNAPAAYNSNSSYNATTAIEPAPAKPKYSPKKIEVNSADTTAFQSLYGIGSKLAARIVNFRNKLGGFYSIDQVGETYGVPDSVFQKIKPYLHITTTPVTRLNINTATYEMLNAHPYISSQLAYLLIKHRKEKGNFTSMEAVKELVSQTKDTYDKVVPYLKIE